MDDATEWTTRRAAHAVGESLDDLSVEDLTDRIALLRREIERLEAARAAKEAALARAGSIFKL
ncbi:DUF1192 family protein [Methylobacterium soli]|jgi:uncharacterized small protein (DUF1192 family)|uniref:DUF1192 domain-containing protein n=1 Tax=Methylobacterium soli TaxID=553447 RepID=A0A6L3SUK2_9HYPH|nr:DUF1192 family protein [Methylobacterium soli]KAB1077300.1 DUF1192 domain-containing protein [Methylobacterium soli]GJE46323.1 hypothetical protein AEGHOMDF_5526 [Methylobacterium soli]